MASDEGLGKKVLGIGKKTGEITQEKMLKALDWSYEATLNGLPGQKTVDDLVEDYLSKYDKETAIKKLVNFQTTKAAVSGFVTGFGGLLRCRAFHLRTTNTLSEGYSDCKDTGV